MPEQNSQVHDPLIAPRTRTRKELLAFACAIDRLAWLKTCQVATHRNGPRFASEVLNYLDLFSGLVPGFPGRWLRRANSIAQVGRMLGWLRL